MIRIGAPLPPLGDDQAALAERVAGIAMDALGTRDPTSVSEVCALMLCAVLQPQAVHNPDAIEDMTLTVMNDVIQRVTAHTAAANAIVKAMAATKPR